MLTECTSKDSDCADGFIDAAASDSLLSKDGLFQFSLTPPSKRGRPLAQNQVTDQQGIPKNVSSKIFSPLSTFEQFITTDIIETILDSTNHYLAIHTQESFRLSEKDLWLYFAALFYLGIMKSKNSSSADMWDKEKGIPYLSKCIIL